MRIEYLEDYFAIHENTAYKLSPLQSFSRAHCSKPGTDIRQFLKDTLLCDVTYFDRLLTVMTGKANFLFKHAVSWVRKDFGKSKKVRFLDSVNSGTAVFPQASPNQHDELSFESWKDIEGEGKYF